MKLYIEQKKTDWTNIEEKTQRMNNGAYGMGGSKERGGVSEGTGGPPPLKNHKKIRFLSIIGPNPL